MATLGNRRIVFDLLGTILGKNVIWTCICMMLIGMTLISS